MYLFHAISTYQLLEMVAYKSKYHSDDKCVLMITDSLVDKVPKYKELNAFFDDIIVYPISLPKEVAGKNLIEKCKNFFDSVFSGHNYTIDSFETKYVACAHYYFGIYLAGEKIPFVFFEDAAGIKSRPEILVNIEKNKYPVKQGYNLQLGLYDGTAECIEKSVCNHNSQTKEIIASTEHFDVVETFLELPEEMQEKIKSFFVRIDTIETLPECVMLLTQHLANLKILSFEDHILIYQMVMDYFFKDKTVVFKPHPDDIMYYGQLFPECQIIREKFPSEFLPVMFTNKPKTIATISSTAIFNLRNFFDDSFFLDVRFEKDFKALHRYYTALMLYKQSKMNCSVVGIGDNKPMLSELCKAQDISYGTENGTFYIIDDVEAEEGYSREDVIALAENLPSDSAILFINFKQDFCFYDIHHKQIWNDIVPICIRKKQTSGDEFYASTQTETVYFYSKNEELKKMAQELDFTNELKYTGMEISIDKLTPEQKQIRVLEGVLEATEKRLLYYMNLVEEMKKES